MAGFFSKLFKTEQKHLKKLEAVADQVVALEEEMAALSDDELKAKTPYFKKLLEEGKTLEDIKVEAFAVAREAAKRVLGQFPYRVQIVGALVIHDGDIAEMKTGEGKTLTATMAVYLNALSGKGVHVITVNEYLATRDAEWMGAIYRFLGLTVGCNGSAKNSDEKREAFACDITYTTSQDLGFDYLRDNMVKKVEQRVLRGLNHAVIDEADSILIDESRTPLIISGGSKNTAKFYIQADDFVKKLKYNADDAEDSDYTKDEERRRVTLTSRGITKAEKAFNIQNLYAPEHSSLVHLLNQALSANYVFARDVDYVVDNDEIQIVDPFTGRILKGREYSNGLHQALQAKEGVKIKEETVVIATVTLQNFFRLYDKVSGMTGTAKTEEEEFLEIYNMRVVCIPPNKPVIRIDDVDEVYANKNAKYKALIEEIKKRHEKKQPVLVGTISVEVSEIISERLKKEGIKHEVLNAKNHAREAEIISRAGELGAVTIATNMAGRGTDIKISDEVRALGGLCVLGSERHDSRRIDNQLRGRSGRQGDVGYSKFYVSLDDDLMIRFGGPGIRKMFARMGDDCISGAMVNKAVSSAQGRVEGMNFDTRKSTLDYDDVLRQQREVMYKQRDEVLETEDVTETIDKMYKKVASSLVNRSCELVDGDPVLKSRLLAMNFAKLTLGRFMVKESDFDGITVEEAEERLYSMLKVCLKTAVKDVPVELVNEAHRHMLIDIIDKNWTRHIDDMSKLKDNTRFRGYAQMNPLNEYINEGFKMFEDMMNRIMEEVITYTLVMQIKVAPVPADNVQEAETQKDKKTKKKVTL